MNVVIYFIVGLLVGLLAQSLAIWLFPRRTIAMYPVRYPTQVVIVAVLALLLGTLLVSLAAWLLG